MSKIFPTFCDILISERGKNMMEWNCNHCSSQCLREMEDSVCVFVKDFFHISSFPREKVKIYWEKYRKLPTLRFCLPEGRYLVIRQVGPLFRRLGHLCYGMAEFQRLVDCHWYSWAGYYDYWNGRLAIPPQYHSIRNDGEFTAAGYAIVRGKSDWFDGEWQKNYMLIDRTGHNTSGNIFQKIGMVDTSDFSMFGPYDDLLGYSVRMGTKYGFADYTGQLIVPCQYEREIHLFPVAGRYQFVQWEEGHGVVPLQEACHEDDVLYQAIQRHFEQEAKEQRPDPLGESAEHFLWETGLFEEPIRKEQGRDPARPNCRYFRVMLQPGRWAILRCTWLESN